MNFYSAEINLFSPFGLWVCAPTPNCGDCLPPSSLDRGAVSFCVDAEPVRVDPVDLTIAEDGSTSVKGFGPPPCTSAAAAGFLGDASSLRHDRDGFRFDGQAGEKIAVTLDRSGSRGSTGTNARLVLRDGGGRQLGVVSGALPLKLAATLPAAGRYVVVALEAEEATSAKSSGSAGGQNGPFRGDFLVTVRSVPGRPAANPCGWGVKPDRALALIRS